MTTFGQDLKRERELRGISLAEIADFSKISLRLLRALEDNQLSILPGKFFTRGIIRTYAKYLGLEEEAVLNQYYEIIQSQENQNKVKVSKKEYTPEASKQKRKLTSFSICVLFILVILFSLFFLLQKKKSSSLDITSLPQPTIILMPEEMPPPIPEPKEEERKELNLKLIFHQETWIQVYADGKIKLEDTMSSGQQVEIIASDNLLINLRNAGGLTYLINNRKGKPFGKSGENIYYIRITLENFEEVLK